jgi:DNA-binding NarL/FixJ family response regulator
MTDVGLRRPRVLLADDHQLLVQTLSMALEAEGLEVHASTDPNDVVTVAQRVEPDLVLLDLDLGGGRFSTDYVPALVGAGRRVVMLTGVADTYLQQSSLAAGAEAVLSKGMDLDELVDAIVRVSRGESLLGEARRQRMVEEYRTERDRRLAERRPFETLSAREQQVLAGLMTGLSAEQLAARDYVSLPTVRSQIRSIFTKLGVNSQLAAVAMARQAGWRPDDASG